MRGLVTLGAPLRMGGGGAKTATFTVTTTDAETLTLQGLTVAAGKTVTVDWGDSSSTDYSAGAGTRTHNYAGAGTWIVTIADARNVTALDLRDAKITQLNSEDISGMALTYLYLYLPLATGTFDSADISGMALTSLRLSLSSATGTFDSADISGMALTYLNLSLSSGTVTFDSADISGMALTYLNLSLPLVTGTTIARADWSSGVLRKVTSPTIQMGLNSTEVADILLGAHDDIANRTASGGTLNVAGNNAAPSGTLQAACPPTTGKEAAYELVNDSCGETTHEYAAVTLTT